MTGNDVPMKQRGVRRSVDAEVVETFVCVRRDTDSLHARSETHILFLLGRSLCVGSFGLFRRGIDGVVLVLVLVLVVADLVLLILVTDVSFVAFTGILLLFLLGLVALQPEFIWIDVAQELHQLVHGSFVDLFVVVVVIVIVIVITIIAVLIVVVLLHILLLIFVLLGQLLATVLGL